MRAPSPPGGASFGLAHGGAHYPHEGHFGMTLNHPPLIRRGDDLVDLTDLGDDAEGLLAQALAVEFDRLAVFRRIERGTGGR
jgi:hypothetical protein